MSRHSLLVVDDSATQLEALRLQLTGAGFDVVTARSGEEAVETVGSRAFDLVLSDVVMPGMSGFDLCRRVKALSSGERSPLVVLLTSLTDPTDIVRGLECGADNYITKPYEPDHLLSRIRYVLENRELRRAADPSGGVTIRFLGTEFHIESDRERILDLLLSSFEELIRTNNALQESKRALADAHTRELEAEQTLRHQAETSAGRMELLARTSAVFSSTLDEEAAAGELIRLLVPTVSELCVLYTFAEDGGIRWIQAAHADPAIEDRFRKLIDRYDDVDVEENPWVRMIQREQAELVRTLPPEVPASFFDDDVAAAGAFEELAPTSALFVPLLARGRTLGALALFGSGGSDNLAGFVSLIEEIAGRAALAIDNLRLYGQASIDRLKAQRAARRISGLQGVTAALSEALTPEEVMAVIVEQGTQAAGAEGGAVLLADASAGGFAVERVTGFSPEQLAELERFAADEAVPINEAIATRRVILFGAASADTTDTRADGDHTPNRSCEWAVVPMIVKSTALGALVFCFGDNRGLTAEDRSFMLALARQAAQALERARLFEAEKTARAEAEAATRARDDVLATVSHDLRNPLNVIFTGATMLLEMDLPEEKKTRHLRMLRRSAEGMNRLINDLLDVSRMEAGRFSVEAVPEPANTLVLEARELLLPLAQEKSVNLGHDIEPDLPDVLADRERMLQVFSNLIGNALKFTPADGKVTVRARREDDGVVFSISDTGSGIEADNLPHIFDRFWQAQETRRAGAGLGLAIARGIVDAHGGRIWAESAPGDGSSFFFSIPAARAVTPV